MRAVVQRILHAAKPGFPGEVPCPGSRAGRPRVSEKPVLTSASRPARFLLPRAAERSVGKSLRAWAFLCGSPDPDRQASP